MKKKRLVFVYILLDWIASVLAWALFYFFRKSNEYPYLPFGETFADATDDLNFWLGLIGIPIGWIVLHCITGAYSDRKSVV